MSQPQFENPDSKSFYYAFEDRHQGSVALSIWENVATSIIAFPAKTKEGLQKSAP
jgi:hypothetical protein